MKVTWLGQAGLLFEQNGIRIMVDPYLSDSCRQLADHQYRRMPIDESIFAVRPDILIATHEHRDHLDPETFPRFLTAEKSVTVLAPYQAWQKVRTYGGNHNYVMMNPHTVWTEHGITFRAVRAEHSDPTAIGIIIDDGERKYYVTGDTLYNEDVLADIKEAIDVVFLPINGKGNNMNAVDAAVFAKKIGAGCAVPIHWGMFDEVDPCTFSYEKKVIPEIYQELQFVV